MDDLPELIDVSSNKTEVKTAQNSEKKEDEEFRLIVSKRQKRNIKKELKSSTTNVDIEMSDDNDDDANDEDDKEKKSLKKLKFPPLSGEKLMVYFPLKSINIFKFLFKFYY
jgi:hypothetical protein